MVEPEDRVLEIATGKGEFIIRLAEKYGVGGTGVDISPYCVSDAGKKLETLGWVIYVFKKEGGKR